MTSDLRQVVAYMFPVSQASETALVELVVLDTTLDVCTVLDTHKQN